MQLKVTFVLISFFDCLHQFDYKKSHDILALMLDPKFKDPFILNKCVGIKKITIVTMKCDFEIPIPFYVHFIKKFIILQNTHCHNLGLWLATKAKACKGAN